MSAAHDRFAKALEETRLPKHELEKILFYVRLLVYARRGRITPPKPEKWQQLPFWLQWKIYIGALFWAKVHDVHACLFARSEKGSG